MTAEVTQLEKKIAEQDKQIESLKQAIQRLERQLRAVSVVANRAQGASFRITEEVRVIQHKLRK
jgi:cell division protein FtsL